MEQKVGRERRREVGERERDKGGALTLSLQGSGWQNILWLPMEGRSDRDWTVSTTAAVFLQHRATEGHGVP